MRSVFALLSVVLIAAGCATPASLPPGASSAQVQEKFGKPTGSFATPDGLRRIEYAGGAYGVHTWMLDFDGQDRLVKATQVREERYFNQILAGMTRDQVRVAIGAPSETSWLGFQKQVVWSYRYYTPFCQWFQLGLDTSGRVTDSGYYPDPLCSRDGDRSR